ncbi:ATP-NAD kinase family protein [Microbacterium sp. SD291]|uniref:ATP-NAD kinase family protein n=1 Tax=Microbacterium sp. SD291 TaxID=2782007 RepID=UPI001A975A40|nr:NAD(+)/NADH kinase [Microbacterium sp. SD291]MBO0980653.1 NAD(+)/NADH kinase [Microbacterium sp. SD291]
MIGLVVNPVAGVGGPAGLAGSDGADVQRLAFARGARSRVQERTAIALRVLAAQHPGVSVVTAAGAMGADAVRAAGLVPRVVHTTRASSEGADTSRAVDAVAAAGADLILVVGGDGTLRDAVAGLGLVGSGSTTPENRAVAAGSGAVSAETGADLRSHGGARGGTTPQETPTAAPSGAESGESGPNLRSCERAPAVLGVPAGVKMYSPVFAVSPSAAGAVAAEWITQGGLPVEEREVLDIDEAAMRRARVDPALYGFLRVPYRSGRTQARKAATPTTEAAAVEAAARGVVARMLPGIRYLLGPGGTTAEVARRLGVEGSPLGVDVVLDGVVIRKGASEHELLDDIAQGPAKAVVTVIGGQGFLLGRGNQQLSASVLRALGDDPLLVVAPEQKLIDLHGRPLIVDTGDAELDAKLAGHVRIITGVGTSSLYAVAAPELVPTQ